MVPPRWTVDICILLWRDPLLRVELSTICAFKDLKTDERAQLSARHEAMPKLGDLACATVANAGVSD